MKIIIFDMDGVLFDSIGFAREVFLANYPGTTAEIYNEIHSGNYHEGVRRYDHLRIQETEEERAKNRAEYMEKKSKTPLFEGIKQILKELQSFGYVLAINTNAYDRNCIPLLERSNIKDYFDFIATADLSKDKVEKFQIIRDRYGAENKDVVFITDALGDLRDADTANVPTITVTWGVHDISFFEREEHDNLFGVANTVGELKDFILSYFSTNDLT